MRLKGMAHNHSMDDCCIRMWGVGYKMKQLDYQEILKFYEGKRVLITGNTGFKGSWLTHILLNAGAIVAGYSLRPPTEPSLFTISGLEGREGLKQVYADVRDLDEMKRAFQMFQPEIVFHLAAQPIVRDSFKDPVHTYSTNVMGTVNVCEAIRMTMNEAGAPCVRSFLNVTTDKVYKNTEWCWGYREIDELDGLDPYSNSKSCSELVTHSYQNSFFMNTDIRVSTARAGNVIGGGDFSNDRIIPDCVRSIMQAEDGKAQVNVRNPYSTRPYEHVLEPLFAYMLIAKKQHEDERFAGYYNVGPEDADCVTTGDLVNLFCRKWNENQPLVCVSWENVAEKDALHEAGFLKLDCSKLKAIFGWQPRWHIEDAVAQTINWTKAWLNGGDIKEEMDREIEEFINLA